MPPRSNQFQRVIRELYRSLSSTGVTIRESAMLPDGVDGVEREIDVLVEGDFAGHKISLAVECRDYSRAQNIQWIDELIGKYRDLPVDKVVAVSTSEFSEGARRKAASVNIECLTAVDAESVDWAREVNPNWSILTHRHWLHHLSTYGLDGATLTHSQIDEDGTVRHDDGLSEKVFSTLLGMFRALDAGRVEGEINGFIQKNLEKYSDESSKRYCEITFDSPEPNHRKIMLPEGPLEIGSVLYGVCTNLDVEKVPVYKKVVKDTAVAAIKADAYGISFTTYIVTDSAGRHLGTSVTLD